MFKLWKPPYHLVRVAFPQVGPIYFAVKLVVSTFDEAQQGRTSEPRNIFCVSRNFPTYVSLVAELWAESVGRCMWLGRPGKGKQRHEKN